MNDAPPTMHVYYMINELILKTIKDTILLIRSKAIICFQNKEVPGPFAVQFAVREHIVNFFYPCTKICVKNEASCKTFLMFGV